MSDIVESWKHVDGYEGNYSVSNLGRVRNETTGKVLKPGTHSNGYHKVNLYADGKSKTHRVHRLVAIAFVVNADPERRDQVDHIDGVRVHNLASNLRWTSSSQNSRNSRSKTSRNGSPTSSVFKGVCFDRPNGKWRASIFKDGKSRHLGCFTSEIDAARAYDAAARGMFGDYARVNFDDE
jgi:hypothetical protein